MSLINCLFLALFLGVAAGGSDPLLSEVARLNPEANKILHLDEKNFEHDTQVTTGGTTGDWFVLFFSESCPHCHNFMPTWKQFAGLRDPTMAPKKGGSKAADSSRHNINVAAVSCSTSPSLCRRFRVPGLPHLIYFRGSRMYRFVGERSVANLLSFVASPPIEAAEIIPAELTTTGNIFEIIRSIAQPFATLQKEMPLLFYLAAAMGTVTGLLLLYGLINGLPSDELEAKKQESRKQK